MSPAALASDDAPRPEEQISTLRLYVEAARRRRSAIAVCFALPILAAILLSLTKDSTYEGSAQVVISRQNLANALTATPDPTGDANDFIRIVQTQADIARSPEVLANVIERAPASGLDVRGLRDSSTVDPKRDADILIFHVWNSDSRLAARLASIYAEEFVEFRRSLDSASLERAQEQLQGRLDELEVDGRRQSQLYQDLVGKQQELQTLEALQTANATVTAPALEARKTAPTPKKYFAIAIVAGFLLAAGVVATLEALDTRVRSAHQIEESLRIPFLASIPPPPPDLEDSLLMLRSPRAAEAEAFRILRTSLQFSNLDKSLKTLMVTSAVAHEGKSTTVSNLAVAMARTGAAVVLVDLDLRQPSLERLFDLPPGPGITDVALGRGRLEDVLSEVELPDVSTTEAQHSAESRGRLAVLRSGRIPPDPGEFVTSPFVEEVLHELSARFDIVLIDSPPLLQVGDALGLSNHVDALFLVARLQLMRSAMLEGLARALASSPAKTLGFVVTGDGMGQRYGYAYGYEYGYAEPGDVSQNARGSDQPVAPSSA